MSSLALSRPLVPEAPRAPGWPILGVLPSLRYYGAIDYFTRAWRRYGDTFRVRLGTRDVLIVVHPEAIEQVFLKNRENYIKGPTYRSLRMLTGEGLLTLEGEPWRKRRRMAQPAFHKESVRALTASMVAVTRDTLDALHARLPDGGIVDAHHEMMRLTLEVVGETLFGQRLGDRTDASAGAFGDALELLSRRGNNPVAIPLSVPTPGNLRLRRALALLDELVYAIIGRAREASARPTLLSMLCDARDADSGEALTDRELRDEVITLVLAGHETTALTLTWGFTLLGRHPEVVARMRAEVAEVLGDREPTADDLPRLIYLRQVIDEILRLRSPVWALGRDVVGDDTLCGVRVRAGETVMPLPYLTHRHPGFWEEPERFDPDRFAPKRAEGRHHWAYYPFSAGPRMCIGNLFSIAEAQVILAMLLQRCDVELTSMRPVPLAPMMTLRPGGPVEVRLRWRKRAAFAAVG
ncbi:MAG TPA: cytochrome P450 [Polyangia bacterium]|jgi:cytochrome P450